MKVKICSSCHGIGKITECVGSHQCEYETHPCTACSGTGRIITGRYRYSVSFDTNKLTIYDIDSKIVNLIRLLENNK